MYVIGITGGVGSGKSYAAYRLQEKLGATLLIADELGHVVMEPGRSAYCQIVEHFGQNIVSSDGSIDRAALAEIVFSDARARDWLNQVIHPAVIEYIRDTIRQNRTRSGILLIETALMYETGCDSLCDEVWLVYVPEEERIRRLASDRGYSEQKSKAIIQSQISETLLREKVQRIVPNDGTKEDLERALDALLTTLDTTALGKG